MQNEDGEEELILGDPIKKESQLLVRHTQEIKSFSLGSRINFSEKEFSYIAMCLHFFGEELVMKMNEYGFKEGLLSDKSKSTESS